MPLSEHEQRILRQIEQQLEQDPTFATRGYRVSRTRLVLLTIGLVGAIVVTVMGLSVSFWLAFAAFLLVLALAVALEREVRLVARERLGTLPISAWLGGGGRRNRSNRESRPTEHGPVGRSRPARRHLIVTESSPPRRTSPMTRGRGGCRSRGFPRSGHGRRRPQSSWLTAPVAAAHRGRPPDHDRHPDPPRRRCRPCRPRRRRWTSSGGMSLERSEDRRRAPAAARPGRAATTP